MKKKKTIKERVLEDVFDIWDNKGVEFARDELKKMYLREYSMLTDIEDKRLILHNLAVAEKDSKNGSMESVKQYTKILKEDMDKVPNYKTGETACLYARVIMNYAESNKNELSKEELKEIYEYCYKVYRKYDDKNENGYLTKLISKFNLSLINENFNTVLSVFEDVLIHNNNTQYAEALNGFENDIKNVDEALYNQALLLKQNRQTKIS